MEWLEVYTVTQRQRLLDATLTELKSFIGWASDKIFKEDVALTNPSCYAVLVFSGGKLMERDFRISTDQYTYSEVLSHGFEEVIGKYKLVPKDISAARSAVEKKIKEAADKEKEKSAAVEELGKLINSPAVSDLLSPLILSHQFNGEELVLDNGQFGLHERGFEKSEKIPQGVFPIFENDFQRVIDKYSLTAKSLANWRERIEKA